jgi:hypothetical protein
MCGATATLHGDPEEVIDTGLDTGLDTDCGCQCPAQLTGRVSQIVINSASPDKKLSNSAPIQERFSMRAEHAY